MIKNINKTQLKKVIFMPMEEYENLINNITDGCVNVIFLPEYNCLEYDYVDSNKKIESNEYWKEYIKEILSKHFDVKVTYVNANIDEYFHVWICYESC